MDTNSALLTDQYELVMAYGYWKLGRIDEEGVFQVFFRKHPFQNPVTICCGLERVIQFIQNWHFTVEEINYLSRLKTPESNLLFSPEFLKYLKNLRFTGNIDAIPEGTLVFPHQPLLRIQAPIIQCQLLETALINFIQFSSLIATKAARIKAVAGTDEVIEFGLRRAQGPDGGVLASRAAFIGGCDATSNALAGMLYHIPIRGTQAHSWIMSFDDELTAFEDFAKAIPENTILLVDTYNTLKGIRNAIIVAQQLTQQGHQLIAVRLDSGNLAELSQQARLLLDAAGLQQTKILASGDLDEFKIAALKHQNANIDLWGVGTRLATAFEQPALDAVYKLAAIRKTETSPWQYKIKISDTPSKTTLPGIHQVRRYFDNEKMIGDVIFNVGENIVDHFQHATHAENLLQPIYQNGKLIYQSPPTPKIREQSLVQQKIFNNNEQYSVQHSDGIKNLLQQLTPS
jgi:nicotinate phosphoribosyltransferase